MRVLLPLVLLVSAMSVLPDAAAAQAAVPAVPADAYLDANARELVRLARERRAMVDTRIQRYQTTAHERMSAGLRTGITDRLLFRRETVSRIDWTRDTVRVDVLAAREVLPPVSGELAAPADLLAYAPSVAFDPVDSEMLLRLDSTSLKHPLASEGEAHYRFSTGDTTVIRLPDGRLVRLRELRFQPRRRDPQLINGSFWLEAETHAVVQAYFRLARAYDSRRDSDDTMLLGAVRADIEIIAIDYGLWDFRWWLPRSVVAQGVVQFGMFRMPLNFERRYDDYAVTGDTLALPRAVAEGEVARRPCRPPAVLMIGGQIGGTEPSDSAYAAMLARQDSLRTVRRDSVRVVRAAQRDSARAAGDTTVVEPELCERAFIVTHAPRSELLGSELLPRSIYSGEGFTVPSELAEIMRRARAIQAVPWQFALPLVQWDPRAPGVLRYNRVEGLSYGPRVSFDFGRLGAEAEVRIGTEGEFGARLGVQRESVRSRIGLAGYRRLDVLDVSPGAFGAGSSLAALTFGRDDNDYFRATGLEVTVAPPEVRRQWYDLRLFAERQQAVEAGTNGSIRRLLDSDFAFRPNIAADSADQLGALLRLRASAGLNPRAPRVAGELRLLGETGDFAFFRPAATLRATTPLGKRLSLLLEGAGGTGIGEVPLQRHFQLGGAASLRGYDAASLRGDSYARGTAELGIGVPFARLAVFSDVGWAGPRDGFSRARPLKSVGAGITLLDGVFRFDVARGIDAGQWRAHLRLGN